jgi:hypothetical protein
MPIKKVIIPGTKYINLTVIKEVGKYPKGRYKYLCLCDCGNYTHASSSDLGKTKSCGCLKINNCNNLNKQKRIKAGCDPNKPMTKEELLHQARKYYNKNKESILKKAYEKQKQLWLLNPDIKNKIKLRKYISFLKLIVVKRDNSTCQMCFNKITNPICHHILPVRVAPDRVDDLNNLICLCRACHIKAHDGNYKRYDVVWAELALARNTRLINYE